jgi:hypothetical protein
MNMESLERCLISGQVVNCIMVRSAGHSAKAAQSFSGFWRGYNLHSDILVSAE